MFTRFNAILGTMLVVIIIVGPIQDATFGVVLVANALIGIVQEVRAKRTLDQLAVLERATRAGRRATATDSEIAVEGVVLDDLLVLRTGDQIPCDGVVRHADGLEVDESLLTGESDPLEQGRRRRGAVGELRGRGLRPLPGDRGGQRLVRARSSRPRRGGSSSPAPS